MATEEIVTAGVKPKELFNHMTAETVQIMGMTANEFFTSYAGTEFNFPDLEKKFRAHCQDYNSELDLDTPMKRIQFSAKVLYTIGPESRRVRKGMPDKNWQFEFKYPSGTHCVYVATF